MYYKTTFVLLCISSALFMFYLIMGSIGKRVFHSSPFEEVAFPPIYKSFSYRAVEDNTKKIAFHGIQSQTDKEETPNVPKERKTMMSGYSLFGSRIRSRKPLIFDSNNPRALWRAVHDNINADGLYSESDNIDEILKAMKWYEIVDSRLFEVRSSFKLLLTLAGGQKFVFKPRFTMPDAPLRTCVTKCESPEAEVLTFNIDRLLGYRKAPYAIMRTLNLNEEIQPLVLTHADVFKKRGSSVCLSVACYLDKRREYCYPGGLVPGSLVYWVNYKLKELHVSGDAHPPFNPAGHNIKLNGTLIRQYLKVLLGPPNDTSYCNYVRTLPPYDQPKFFMDLNDMAILDYLVLHRDRKHNVASFRREPQEPILSVHIDHGYAMCVATVRTFPNATLSPVRLCCKIRRRTYNALERLARSLIPEFMELSRVTSSIALTTQIHLEEMIDRIRYVLQTVQRCRDIVGNDVFVDT